MDSKSSSENHPAMISESNCDFAPDFDISNSNESLELSITELKYQLSNDKTQQNEDVQQSNRSVSATKTNEPRQPNSNSETNEHQPNSNSKTNEHQPNSNSEMNEHQPNSDAKTNEHRPNSNSKSNEHRPHSNSKTNERRPNLNLEPSTSSSKVLDSQNSPNELIHNRLIDKKSIEDDGGFGDFKVSKVGDDGGTFPLSSVDQVFLESGEEDELEQTMVQGESDSYYGHNEEKECFTARDR